MTAAVQDCVDLLAIEAGVAQFGRGRRTHSVAVPDIFSSDASLASPDVSTQDEILAGRAQFLNAQTASFQVLVRAEPVDLEGHTRRLQGRVPQLPDRFADVARDYVSFVASLAHQRTLLERHCFVILPDSAGEDSAKNGSHPMVTLVAYARVSTDRQAEKQTIAQQIERLLAYAQERAWQLPAEQIYQDDGSSGARLDRVLAVLRYLDSVYGRGARPRSRLRLSAHHRYAAPHTRWGKGAAGPL